MTKAKCHTFLSVVPRKDFRHIKDLEHAFGMPGNEIDSPNNLDEHADRDTNYTSPDRDGKSGCLLFNCTLVQLGN